MEYSGIGKKVAVIVTVVVLIALGVAIFNLDNFFEDPWSGDDGTGANTIVVDGVSYNPKSLSSYVITFSADEGKTTDTVLLLTFDHSADSYTILHVNRDTKAVLSAHSNVGERLDNVSGRVCEAFSYGDGAHISARSVLSTVSDLLCGLPIDNYLCMDISALSHILDMTEGVKVTLDESAVIGTPFAAGEEFTVDGESVEAYLAPHDGTAHGSKSFAARQKVFLEALFGTLEHTSPEGEAISALYEKILKADVVTNCGFNSFTSIFDCIRDYSFDGVRALSGDYGDGAEFIVDDAQLKTLITTVYYNEIK